MASSISHGTLYRRRFVKCYGASGSKSSTDKHVLVKFKLRYKCPRGHTIHLVGAPKTMGRWNPANSVPFVWSVGDVWCGSVTVTSGHNVEYKYLVKDNNGIVARWQGGENVNLTIARKHNNERVTRVDVSDSWCQSWHSLAYGPFAMASDPTRDSYYTSPVFAAFDAAQANKQSPARATLTAFAEDNTWIYHARNDSSVPISKISPSKFQAELAILASNNIITRAPHTRASVSRQLRPQQLGIIAAPTMLDDVDYSTEQVQNHSKGGKTGSSALASLANDLDCFGPSTGSLQNEVHQSSSSGNSQEPVSATRVGGNSTGRNSSERTSNLSQTPVHPSINKAGTVPPGPQFELQLALQYSQVLEANVPDPTSPEWIDLDRRMALAACKLYSKRDALLQLFMTQEEKRQSSAGLTVDKLGHSVSTV